MNDPRRDLTPAHPGPYDRVELDPYDAVVLVSFGGPERPEDVVPFLENVTRGRGIPHERLLEVGQHYFAFGGRSPINDQCRDLLAALTSELRRRGCALPVVWGNRNWGPYLGDTFRALVERGHRRIVVLTTSAYPSYSSCRQYRENLYDAAADLPLEVDRVRQYATHPGFVTASVDAVDAALERLPADPAPRIVFVTHSIPTTMAQTAGPTGGEYVSWHEAVAAEIGRQVAERRGRPYEHDLAYCSRSGPPSQPWLEPDVNDHLGRLRDEGVRSVVVVPIGFVSDHMEVAYDLDTEAAATARELGLGFVRAASAGTHPAFVAALVDVLAERAAAARDEPLTPAVISGGAVGRIVCAPGCCPNRLAPGRPALCGVEAPAPVSAP